MTLSDCVTIQYIFAFSLRLLLQSDFGGIPSDFYLFCLLLWLVFPRCFRVSNSVFNIKHQQYSTVK